MNERRRESSHGGNGGHGGLWGNALEFKIPIEHAGSHYEDEQTVHVEAGQTVYFECIIGLTLIFEEADDQERAARTVSRLQPLN
jgi:hypothetical protein